MNILFVNSHPEQVEHISDFQGDMLFDGLKSLGHNVYEYPKRMSHMYTDFPTECKKRVWGKCFNLYCRHEPKDRISDDELENYNWDFCILNLHWTLIQDFSRINGILDALMSRFPSNRLCLVDGWDKPDISPIYNVCENNKVMYFKRELYTNTLKYLRPIQFGIPQEKIVKPTDKSFDVAPLIPVNQSIDPSYMSTYTYDNEEDYNEMYQKSYFGLTSKKGGWDTFRHYEILANGCIPWFCDIENCPKNCLHKWPKDLLVEIKQKFKINWNWKDKDYGLVWPHCGVVQPNQAGCLDELDRQSYNSVLKELQDWLKQNGTTEALAKYVLEVCL